MLMDPIAVTLNGIEPFVRLSLFDGQLNEQPLAHDLGMTTVDLVPGAYLARFQTSIWGREKRFVVVPGDEPIHVCPSQIDLDSALVGSAAPLRRTSGFQEEAGRLAASLTRRKPANLRRRKAHGSLFLMCPLR